MPTISVNKMRVHYREQGDCHQPVLLLIHGLGCSLRYWSPVFEAEVLSAYRILALDLPGFGMSEKPEHYDYRLDSQADIILAFLRKLQINDFFLVGHSMGGTIAILLALKAPERVNQLLVIEPNLKASDAQLSKEIIQQQEASFHKHYDEFRTSATAAVQKWFVDVQQHHLEEYAAELMKTTAISMYRSALSLIQSTSDSVLLTQFRQLPMPTSFLIGEETMKCKPMPKELQGTQVQTIVVPGVGHMMMVDNPERFTRTLAMALQ